MTYLADADVLSEPTKQAPSRRVVTWLRQHQTELVVNPIVLGELEYGIFLLPSGRKRSNLIEWFHGGIQTFGVVELNAATAGVWAELLIELRRKGREMPVKDSLIAASARQHDLTIATRNVAHFRHARVRIVNPFTAR
jgi:hypothetical protein